MGDPASSPLTRSAKRVIPLTDKRLAVIAATADQAFRQMHLTVVCLHCGETPRGQNHPSDQTWKLECGCSVRVMANPDRTAST